MDGQKPHLQLRGGTHRAGDGVRDVVELEIEEHVSADFSAKLPYDVGSGGGEELASHLVEPASIAERASECHRLGRRRHVDGDDGNRGGGAHARPSSDPTTSPTCPTPCRSHQRARSRTIRSGARGSRSIAVPMPTSVAPAIRYWSTSSAVDTPPIPISGTFTARRTLDVASTPTGSSAVPLTPPVPKPSAGRRRSTSMTSPGMVLTRVRPSAPASTAVCAVRAMSGSAGDSFTNSG